MCMIIQVHTPETIFPLYLDKRFCHFLERCLVFQTILFSVIRQIFQHSGQSGHCPAIASCPEHLFPIRADLLIIAAAGRVIYCIRIINIVAVTIEQTALFIIQLLFAVII